jgi:hypothetical protein
MKAKIFSHMELIGTTDLQVGDESMGGLFGDFIPTSFYFDQIQKHVWEFWKTVKPDYQKWYSLRLNVQLENGIFLFPKGGYTIDDLEEFPNETKRIDIAGINSQIIQDFFLTDPPRPFIEEPWDELTIGGKITFEDELRKELGTEEKSFFDFLKKSTRHVLFDAQFSAFCRDPRNDDVLFEIRKPNFEKRFALVHLTWIGKKESAGYPRTTFYSDFDEFKYSRMYPDKIDWED